MKKINNQSGFGAIEVLLTLLVVIALVFVGWYIYHTDHKSSTNPPASTITKTTSPTAGWQTYSDDLVSLKYPSTWTVARNDNTSLPGTKELVLNGPNDSIVGQSTGINNTDKASLVLYIFQNSSGAQNNSVHQVYDVLGLNMSQLSNSKLIVTNSNGPSSDSSMPAQEMDLTTSGVNTGSQTLSTVVTVGTQTYDVWVSVADNDATGGTISNLSEFVSSLSVKDVILILNSLSFK